MICKVTFNQNYSMIPCCCGSCGVWILLLWNSYTPTLITTHIFENSSNLAEPKFKDNHSTPTREPDRSGYNEI